MEEWNYQQVAQYLGTVSLGSVRKTLSRWGVRPVHYVLGATGRPEARYDADTVRAAHAARPLTRAPRP
jgi:hypothetical protein